MGHVGWTWAPSGEEAVPAGREQGGWWQSGLRGPLRAGTDLLGIVTTGWEAWVSTQGQEKILDGQELVQPTAFPASSQEGFLQPRRLWARGFNLITCFI